VPSFSLLRRSIGNQVWDSFTSAPLPPSFAEGTNPNQTGHVSLCPLADRRGEGSCRRGTRREVGGRG
jgi:hypothetical protein